VLGLFTRLVAFVVAGEMAVAYFMAHCLPAVCGRPAAFTRSRTTANSPSSSARLPLPGRRRRRQVKCGCGLEGGKQKGRLLT
jgi:hypothetical protein